MPPQPTLTERVAHIHLDPLGGASGDMFISALLDARPELQVGLVNALRAAAIPETVQIQRFSDRRGGITGSRWSSTRRKHHVHQRGLVNFRSHLANSALSSDIREQANSILTLLGQVEAEIHAVPLEEVQFHELGAWDTLVDCVAAAWLVEQLGHPSWSLGPLPLGAGTVETAHGRLPIPAPATLRLLEGFPIRDDGIGGERVTPTGAAILRHLKPSQTWTRRRSALPAPAMGSVPASWKAHQISSARSSSIAVKHYG